MQTLIKEPVPASNSITLSASPNRINHIDGLRGIAIILVLLFHISKAFSNGYIGVHIFLVISGYFLFRNFWNDNYEFSWKKYCSKKITRLFPCTIVVSFFTCLAALCFLPYDIVLKTAKSAIATIVGISNIYYDYTYSDYFAASSITNPLVHTWYLGVIIQLYIIAGCIMFLGKLISTSFKLALVSMLFVVSALLYYMPLWIDCVTPFHAPISTYYWTWGHLWMLLAGAYAPLLPKLGTKIPGKALGSSALFITCLIGLLPLRLLSLRLSAGCACLLDLAAVCASVACICYGGTGWSRVVLNNPIVSAAGKVSFSLYLVHWPIISILAMASASWTNNSMLKLLALSIICVAAWLMYRVVERRSFNAKGVFAAWTVCFLMSMTLVYTDGMKDIVHASANAFRPSVYYATGKVKAIECGPLYDSLPDFRQETHRAGFGPMQCVFEKIPLLYQIGEQSKSPSFILIGDSHAEALYPGLDALSGKEGWSGAYLHTYVIPFSRYFFIYRPFQRWDEEKEYQLIQYLKQNEEITTVFIANRWSIRFGNNYYEPSGGYVDLAIWPDKDYDSFRKFVAKIKDLGKSVVIFRDVPMLAPGDFTRRVWMSKVYGRPMDVDKIKTTRDDYEKLNQKINNFFAALESEGMCTVLHTDEAILQSETFSCYQNGKFYYRDRDHLSYDGSILVIEHLKPAIKRILER